MRARSAAEVGYRSGRCNQVGELIDGPLDGPAGTIPATGRKLVVKAVLITRYENDLAIESRVSFDQVDVLTQLGVLPSLVTV